MIIAAEYSFNAGREVISKQFPNALAEIKAVITQANAQACKIKYSKEKTIADKLLFSPVALN